MTQQEYDTRMAELNAQMNAELEPYTRDYRVLQTRKDVIKGQIQDLQCQSHEIGVSMRTLCEIRQDIKAKYNAIKAQLYIERPAREDEPAGEPAGTVAEVEDIPAISSVS